LSGRSRESVFLSLGGNLGDPARAMGEALRLLDADDQTEIVAVSSLYRTPPWGKLDQPDFLNIAAEIRTSREPRAFLELCLEAERRLKRERRERWGPRLIDIDILLFGDRKVSEAGLEIPHPRMAARAFVLVPLAEIAPELQLDGTPIAKHLRALDQAGIRKVASDRDWWKIAS
jgi:2-amino-4-hydroxy-6-hydroxymethyldihydropteridine diphosphokinase